MTVRETSAESYRFLKMFLPGAHTMIMNVMYSRPDKGNWSAREVRQEIIDTGIMEPDKCLSSSISGRMNEITKDGYIKEDGKRVCEVSGRTVIVRRLSIPKIVQTAFYWGKR